MSSMRTGADYRNSLRDGRRVFVLGEGEVKDVITHPATAAMVDEYVAWYDRHDEPAWKDTLFGPGGPVDYLVPHTSDDLVRMGKCFSATTFLSAGNITHTPAYGHLIALGILHAVNVHKSSPEQIANAEAYRAEIARSGRFLTFAAGAAPIGFRLREDPADRVSLKIVGRSEAGVVVRGKIGMHTSPAFAEDVYIGAVNGAVLDGQRATFVVPVNAPGVTVICRKRAARDPNPFASPLSSRFDELDGQMWLDDVLVPWNRVFLTDFSPEPVARWLFWHQLYCWLSKAEFTLGLALACTQAMGLSQHEATIDYLLDLITDVQTVRSCLTAAERDPEMTVDGYCSPHPSHLAAGSLAMLKARRPRGGAGGVLRRRRLQRQTARGPAADGVGPCRLGARPARARVRAACQWRRVRLARPAAQELRPLQPARQRGAGAARPADADGQPRFDPRRAVCRAPAGGAAPAGRTLVKVLSSIAVQPAVEVLLPRFIAETGIRADFEWNTAPAFVKRLQGGETADLLILNRAAIDTMTRDGRILAGSDVTLASSPAAIAVKAGAVRPDISTPEALKRTLLAARAISYSDPAAGGASGIHFAKVIQQMGIAEAINAKNRFPPPGGLCARFLPTGEVELAIQQVPELKQVPGIEVVGPLPAPYQLVTVFVAGIEKTSTKATEARALLDFLRTPPSAEVFREKGLDPA
jgi:aromatic ring hydroxylase/ABC-type molybdate transport system substrate-binding protein